MSLKNSKLIILFIILLINNCFLRGFYNTDEYYRESHIVLDQGGSAQKIDNHIYIIPLKYIFSKTIKGICIDTIPTETLVYRAVVIKVDTQQKKVWVLFSKSYPVESYIEFGGYKTSNNNLLISLIINMNEKVKNKEKRKDEEIIKVKIKDPKILKKVRVRFSEKNKDLITLYIVGDWEKFDNDVPIEMELNSNLFRDEKVLQLIEQKEFPMQEYIK
jgi:uncharacterized protein YehS (DUF1456 family)